ncbi:hypothetical protein CONCODRAFT_167539 [Conidiobolus coronatus NRRL 28638]|uniref:Uncharacterized protein n=1 Tax=Conidiobolus coronatus (strain ATCC 28846 / CBS 209.66 / NRRL 28638) TaxID=796925 RepID=A0A137PDW7_CONC2|nr:hypothetical protein CONCODRAFT_167539 [Conidiobolus coronatus NRRL 28638]|eukprot:KXN73198.1 hypothetical protein CONCODRAFT_167539 [Conidiobolus coronatus NRRL 28638]
MSSFIHINGQFKDKIRIIFKNKPTNTWREITNLQGEFMENDLVALYSSGDDAKFGYQGKTVLDSSYRKAKVLFPENFYTDINVTPLITQIRTYLMDEPIYAELYALNVYGSGDFFKELTLDLDKLTLKGRPLPLKECIYKKDIEFGYSIYKRVKFIKDFKDPVNSSSEQLENIPRKSYIFTNGRISLTQHDSCEYNGNIAEYVINDLDSKIRYLKYKRMREENSDIKMFLIDRELTPTDDERPQLFYIRDYEWILKPSDDDNAMICHYIRYGNEASMGVEYLYLVIGFTVE